MCIPKSQVVTHTVIDELHGLSERVAMRVRPTGCALAAPPLIDGSHIVADIGAEKGTISLDAKWRPLQARVGPRTELHANVKEISSLD